MTYGTRAGGEFLRQLYDLEQKQTEAGNPKHQTCLARQEGDAMTEPYSSETHDDFTNLFGKPVPNLVVPFQTPPDVRIGASSKSVHLSADDPLTVLNWLDSVTAEVGVLTVENDPSAVWFTFDHVSQKLVVTLRGVSRA